MGLTIWLCTVIALLATVVLNPWIAHRKNRSPWLWLVLGVLFNPIAFVILLCLPHQPSSPYAPPAAP